MPKFTSQEDVARWLNATSPGVSQVFAARAALRALPALAFTFRLHGNQLTSSEHANVALRTFGCLQVAWASSAYPGSHTKLVPAAGNAVSRSQNLSAEDVQRSAVYAVAAASSTAHIIEFARVSANYAIEAVTGPREHFEAMLGAYSADAEVLDQRTSPVTLANSQLWPGRCPHGSGRLGVI